LESQILIELQQQIKSRIDLSHHTTDEQLLMLIEESVMRYAELNFLTSREKQKAVKRIFNSFRGLDVLQPLLEDPTITEIMVNGHQQIFIEKHGSITQIDEQFESSEKLEDIIQMIVAKVNRVVNRSTPIVDARLPDGSRVNVVLPPASLVGPALTIRKFPDRAWTMQQLIELESLSEAAAEFLKCMIETRYNIFISGGTGSGKTTFLNALSTWIPVHERIVSIEDSAELKLDTILNLVRLETRNANTEGKGEISIRDLIRASLRMRPNRIIVGEVRGAEAFDMLQAMNTGHDGSLSTGHSNSSKDMLSRLETMVLSAVHLPVEVIRSQIGSAIEIMIHLSRIRDRSRRVMEIHELVREQNGHIELNPLFLFKEKSETTDRKVIGSLDYTGKSFRNSHKLKMSGASLPKWMNCE
jgi:pilus assembly protein CpaF